MNGRWFAWAAGLSLAACGGVVVLCVCSYRFAPNRAGGDVLNFTHHDPLWWIISARGRLTLCRQVGRDWGREFPGFDAAGFKYGGVCGPSGSLYNLVVPHWFVAALLLTPAVAWTVGAARRRSRKRPGLCNSCGYDLRGNLSGVCPECGVVAASSLPAGP